MVLFRTDEGGKTKPLAPLPVAVDAVSDSEEAECEKKAVLVAADCSSL